MDELRDSESKKISHYKEFQEFTRESLKEPDFRQTIINFTTVFFLLAQDYRIEYKVGANSSREFTYTTTNDSYNTVKKTVIVPCNESKNCEEKDFVAGFNMALIEEEYYDDNSGHPVRKIINPIISTEYAQRYFDAIQGVIDRSLEIK